MKDKPYRRLPGTGMSSGAIVHTRNTLWLAKDHVLSVANQGYSEDYKRFYYRDIQAIVVRKTPLGAIATGLLALPVLLFAGLFLAGRIRHWDGVAVAILGILGGIALLFWLIHVLRGPTCAAWIRTGVQTERLHSLHRLRVARKAIRRLRAEIDVVQGAIAPEHLAAMDLAGSAAVAHPLPPPVPAPPLIPSLRPYASRAHQWLFLILLADWVHSLSQFLISNVFVYLLGIPILLLLLTGVIVALAKQAGTDLDRRVKQLTWTTVGYLMVSYLLGTIYHSVYMVLHPGLQPNSWAYMSAFSKVTPFESPFRLALLLFSVFCSALLGFLGLAGLARFRASAVRVPPPLPEVPPTNTPWPPPENP